MRWISYSCVSRLLKWKEKRVRLRGVMRSLPKVSPIVSFPFVCVHRWIYFSLAVLEGGCDVDRTYAGPKLETLPGGKFGITHEFIHGMIQWFKEGKALPKRYVWEIILGAHEHFAKEESLVSVDLEEGVTCDVIGDVHGEYYHYLSPKLAAYHRFLG